MVEPKPEPSKGFSPARRKIVAAGATGLLAGIAGYFGWRNSAAVPAPPKAATATGSTSAPTAIEGMTSTAVATKGFQPYLNSEFLVSAPDQGETACKLIEISPEIREDTFRGSFVSFTLLFKAAPGFLPEGGICRVRHEHLKEMEIFISPVGGAKDATLLEAVFSERV